MHINFKYFIVSIGSIFIALGLGILIGSSLSTNEAIQKQNSDLIKDIDTKFSELQEVNDGLIDENKSLNKNMDILKGNIEKLSSGTKTSTLSDKKIGIISFDEENTSELTKSAIEGASGTVSFYITIKPSITEKDSVKKINEKFNMKFTKSNDIVPFVIEAIKSSNVDNKLTQLQESGYVKINSNNATFENTSSLVINNTYNMKNKNYIGFESNFIDGIKSSKHILLAQVTDSPKDLFELYSKSKVTTLSNVDEKLGQLSLATLLNTKADGNYGKASTNYVYMPSLN